MEINKKKLKNIATELHEILFILDPDYNINREEKSHMSESSFLVGIDLGTSRSVIIAEDGKKAYVESVVGWPSDIIGIKVIGKAVVFGQEAIENRESLDLCYPLSDGVIKEGVGRDLEAVEELINHLLSLVGASDRNDVCAVIGVPARASVQSKKILLEVAKKCINEVMLISEPFSVAYKEEKLCNSIVVDIGAGTTDLCAMKGRIPDEKNQVTIKKAGNSVDDVLLKALLERYPDTQVTINIVKRLKEQYGTVMKPKDPIVVKMRVAGKLQAHDITDEIVESCSLIVPNIIEELEKLIIGYDPDFMEAAMSNIILAGGMSGIKGLDELIEQDLAEYGDVKVHITGDQLYTGAEGALMLGKDIPVKFWKQLGELSEDS